MRYCVSPNNAISQKRPRIYIERNPLKAQMVESISEYRYSSYHFYANQAEDTMIAASPAFLSLHENDPQIRSLIYRQYLGSDREYEKELNNKLQYS